MIDWNDNAKAAVECFADWAKLSDNGLLGEFDKYMSPTQKTVADAVKGKWVKDYNMSTLSSERPLIGFNPAQNVFFSCESGYIFSDNKDGEYQVSTLDQFEAYVKEQEGEKWTHRDGVSDCRIVHTDGDFSWVNYKTGEKYVVHNSCLKPIKPTISESEAIGILVVNKHLSFAALLEDYDVVKD